MDYPTSTCLMEVSITYSPYMSEDSLMFGIIIVCRGMGDSARRGYRAAGLSTTPSVRLPLPHRLMRLVMLTMGHWRIPRRGWAGAQEGPLTHMEHRRGWKSYATCQACRVCRQALRAATNRVKGDGAGRIALPCAAARWEALMASKACMVAVPSCVHDL